jgi:hypothetical protein
MIAAMISGGDGVRLVTSYPAVAVGDAPGRAALDVRRGAAARRDALGRYRYTIPALP